MNALQIHPLRPLLRGASQADDSTAYEILLAAIDSGLLPPGSRLREAKLADEFRLSRTPIRDALKRLEAEGLIVHEPYRGAVVASLGYAQTVELYSLREVIEGMSAALAAVHATAAEVELLEEMVARDRGLVDNAEQLAHNNRLFHKHISFCAKNEVLGPLLKLLETTLVLLPGNVRQTSDRARQSVEEHAAIVDRIAARDTDGAEEAARLHVQNALRIRIRETVYGSQGDPAISRTSRVAWRADAGASAAALGNVYGAEKPPTSLLAERAYQGLYEAISDKRLLPGTRLVERDLAEFLDLSRTPIREALRRLEADGLIQSTRPRGYIVTQLDGRKTRDLYAIREFLEGAAARLATMSASPREVELLLNMIVEEGQIVGDVKAMARFNRLLHQAIYEAANNRYLFRALNSLRDVTMLLGPTTLVTADRPEQAHAEHAAIVDAIAQRDAPRAEAAARNHISMAFRARLAKSSENTAAS